MHKALNSSRRIAIGCIGGAIVVVGIVAIPYPGPGWLIVFAGLSVLATEFTWAQTALDYARGKYDAWQDWVAKQPLWFKSLIWLMTAAIVIVTVWLINGYGFINHWLNLRQDWLDSPILH